jgi:hypothetical protein
MAGVTRWIDSWVQPYYRLLSFLSVSGGMLAFLLFVQFKKSSGKWKIARPLTSLEMAVLL